VIAANAPKILELVNRSRPLVFSLEVGKFPQCFQEPFRHFAAFWAIEITTEFLVVGMAKVTQCFLWIESLHVLYQRPQGLTVAQVLDVIEATRSGSSAKKFHAAQDLSTISS